MSETPGDPEYYTPSADAAPPPVPQPQSIVDAAAQWNAGDGNTPVPDYSQQYAPPLPPAPYGYAPPPPYLPGGPRPTAGLSIASLVVGLIAFVTGLDPGWGILLGVIAVILGAIALAKKQSKGMAISGIVTGALGAIASAALLALFIVGVNSADDYAYDDPFTPAPGDGVTTLGPTSVEGSLSVTEQAFGPTTYDDTVTWFVVILNNPGPGSYPNAEVTVNALDASGAVIDTAWSYGTIVPGESAVGSAFYDLDGAEVASLQVVAPPVDAMSSDVREWHARNLGPYGGERLVVHDGRGHRNIGFHGANIWRRDHGRSKGRKRHDRRVGVCHGRRNGARRRGLSLRRCSTK